MYQADGEEKMRVLSVRLSLGSLKEVWAKTSKKPRSNELEKMCTHIMAICVYTCSHVVTVSFKEHKLLRGDLVTQV